MAMTLALLEGISLFAGVCGTIILFARPVLTDWVAVAAVLGQAFVVSLCGIVAFYSSDLYDRPLVRDVSQLASRLAKATGLAFLLFAAFYTFFPATKVAESPFTASLLLVIGLVLPIRTLSYGLMRSRLFLRRVLILGTGPLARSLVEEIEANPGCGCAIIGVVDDAVASGDPPLPYPLLGPLGRLDKIVEKRRPDRIIVALPERRRLPVLQLLQAQGCGILIEDGLEVYERFTGKLALEFLTPSGLLFCEASRKSRLTLALGRGMSLVSAVVGLVALAPLLGLIALAIKLDSQGPVFFVQDRVGAGGKRFKLIKFRTMHPASGETSEWARDNGHRITRVGNWLRKFRLDEIPQFVNILLGDMNLVGPRPHPASNFELFVTVLRNVPECGEQIPYYSLRSMVRPGLTGWAQVRNGYANGLEEEIEKARYDLYYIKHMSLWLDLRILFETVKIVLMGRGSGAPDTHRTEVPMGASGQLTLRTKIERERAA